MVLLSPKMVVTQDLKIIWIMLVVHEVGKLILATKLNSLVIGSHRSIATLSRNLCFSPWISHELWFAKYFIVVHTSSFVKSIGSWAFGTKWSLVLCHEVYTFVQQSTTYRGIYWMVESSSPSKLFHNYFRSLLAKYAVFFFVCALSKAFLMLYHHDVLYWKLFVKYLHDMVVSLSHFIVIIEPYVGHFASLFATFIFQEKTVELLIISNPSLGMLVLWLVVLILHVSEFVFENYDILICLLRIGTKNVKLTRQGWKPRSYIVT